MKLSHRVFLLLSIPVACQLVSVAVLSGAFASLESAGRREANAKKVVVVCQELEGLMGIKLFQLARKSFLPETLGNKDCSAEIKEDLKTLRELCADNAEAAPVVDKIKICCEQYIKLMEDLSRSYVPGQDALFFSYIMYQSDFFDSLSYSFANLKNQSSRLSEIYGRMADEFRPIAQKARNDLRMTIVIAVVLNLSILVVFAYAIHKQTLSRLKILMRNIREFSHGQPKLDLISGNDELAELNKMFAEVSEERARLDEIRRSMTAMVSHDLRAPLSSMIVAIDMMLEVDDTLTPATARKLQRVRSSADRLKRLSNTLLDIEKMESGKLECTLMPVRTADIIDPSTSLLMELATSRKIELRKNFEDQLVGADLDRTVQVLTNLVSNAVKFAPQKSVVEVNARQTAEGMIRFEVIDAGPGVSPSEQSKLFSKFIQLDQDAITKESGSGLGLYICKMLIAAQGGKIGYESPARGGSCFWFELAAIEDLDHLSQECDIELTEPSNA